MTNLIVLIAEKMVTCKEIAKRNVKGQYPFHQQGITNGRTTNDLYKSLR